MFTATLRNSGQQAVAFPAPDSHADGLSGEMVVRKVFTRRPNLPCHGQSRPGTRRRQLKLRIKLYLDASQSNVVGFKIDHASPLSAASAFDIVRPAVVDVNATTQATRPPGTLPAIWVAVICTGVIVYASLQPFTGWTAQPANARFFRWQLPQRVLWNDVAFNIGAYVPLGAALVLVWPRQSVAQPSSRLDGCSRGDPVISDGNRANMVANALRQHRWTCWLTLLARYLARCSACC